MCDTIVACYCQWRLVASLVLPAFSHLSSWLVSFGHIFLSVDAQESAYLANGRFLLFLLFCKTHRNNYSSLHGKYYDNWAVCGQYSDEFFHGGNTIVEFAVVGTYLVQIADIKHCFAGFIKNGNQLESLLSCQGEILMMMVVLLLGNIVAFDGGRERSLIV